MSEEYRKFKQESADEIRAQGEDRELAKATRTWINQANRNKYSYHFEWMGRPIIQYPQDIVAMQELIWHVRPDLIIETGIAHGGSLVFSASILALLDLAEAMEADKSFSAHESTRKVLGIDIDIRAHNRAAIEAHPFSRYIETIEGSSVDLDVAEKVKALAKGYQRILVCLDSNHTHDHVLKELELYAPLTSTKSYCVVFDTIIEDLPEDMFPNRPWGPGDNPKTAVREYLKTHPEFEIDKHIQDQLLITVAPDGYLRRVTD